MAITTVYQCGLILCSLTLIARGLDSISCNPTLEGSELTVTGIWQTRKQMSVRKNDDTFLMVCAGKGCTLMTPFPYKHEEVQDGENRIKFTLRIQNATRNMTGTYGVFYDADPHPARMYCVVAAFDKNIRCHREYLTDSVSVQCVTRNVSPMAKCYFKIISQDNISDVKIGEVKYAHDYLSQDNVFTNVSCKVNIALNREHSARFDLEVAMYPEATGNDSDMELGSRVNITFDLIVSTLCMPTPEGGTQRLSISWSNITPIKISREDSLVTITCLPETPCDKPSLAGYATEVRPTSGGRSTLTLSFQNATRFGSSQGFTSWTVSILGTSKRITEKCWIYEPIVNITCNYISSMDGIKISCNVPRTFPRGMCQFKAKIELDRNVDPKKITYQHDELKNNAGYRTECSSLVPWNMIDSSDPILYVTVYPNITGNIKDAHYGSTATVKLIIEGPRVELQHCPQKVEKGEIVACLCHSNVTVFWNSSSGDVSVKNNTITFKADEFIEYRCHGKDSKGEIGVPKIYTPEISYPPFVMPGKELTYDETQAETLYITCSGANNSSAFTKLVDVDSEVLSWKIDQHVRHSESNIKICEKSKSYNCILTADYKSSSERYPDIVQCMHHTGESITGDGENVGAIVAVVMVILIIGLIIGAIFVLWKVKPSVFYFLQTRWRQRQNEYEDPAKNSYRKEHEEEVESSYAVPSFTKNMKKPLRLSENESENGGYITPVA